MPVEIPKDKWPGKIRAVTLGAIAAEGGTRVKTVTVGGQASLPFMHFETLMPNKPVIAIEVKDRKPDDWSKLLEEAWGDALNDPGAWAKAAEVAGADIIMLALSVTGADGKPTTPEVAVAAVKAILGATGLPVIVNGPGQVDLDNELLVPVSEATKGERIVLGVCED